MSLDRWLEDDPKTRSAYCHWCDRRTDDGREADGRWLCESCYEEMMDEAKKLREDRT